MKTPQETQVKTAYSQEQARKYDTTRFASKSGAEIHKTEFFRLQELLSRISKDEKVIEVGCGTGRLMTECINLGYRVDGMDGSAHMLDQLRIKLEGLSYIPDLKVGDAAHLPYEDNSYDAAYSIRLLNQTESPEYALKIVREMVRIVKPGGYVLVECVNSVRPRIGRNRSRTTRLSIADIAKTGKGLGASIEKVGGAFFLGMGAYSAFGDGASSIVSRIDGVMSKVLYNYCSRIYVMFKV